MRGILWTMMALLSVAVADEAVEVDHFAAKQLGNNLELNTPYGQKFLWGEGGLNNLPNYRIEIPIEDFKSKEQLLEEKRAKEKEDAKNNETPPKPNETNITILEKREPASEGEKEASKPKSQPVGDYDDTARFVLEANRLYNRGKFYEATMVVEELLRRRPDYVRGWVMKGSLLHVQEHKDLARVSWQKAVELEPHNDELKSILKTYR